MTFKSFHENPDQFSQYARPSVVKSFIRTLLEWERKAERTRIREMVEGIKVQKNPHVIEWGDEFKDGWNCALSDILDKLSDMSKVA